jgi:exopolyphosphatase/guanosine-5'-triphosphate,3'-diphosphate pyrophosphatase
LARGVRGIDVDSQDEVMAEITPRWEWRTFGRSFGVADKRIDAMDSTGVQESEELYVLAPGGDIVKLRAGLLDIKTLRGSERGLELWFPILKAEFPLSADDVRAAFSALRLAEPENAPNGGSIEDFLGSLVTPDSGVIAVPLKKRRVRYTIGGCTAERSEVGFGGTLTSTIAIEDPDADKVIAAVRSIAYAGRAATGNGGRQSTSKTASRASGVPRSSGRYDARVASSSASLRGGSTAPSRAATSPASAT